MVINWKLVAFIIAAIILTLAMLSSAEAKLGDSMAMVKQEYKASGYSVTQFGNMLIGGDKVRYLKVVFKDDRAVCYQMVDYLLITQEQIDKVQKYADKGWTYLIPDDPNEKTKVYISGDYELYLLVYEHMIILGTPASVMELTGLTHLPAPTRIQMPGTVTI